MLLNHLNSHQSRYTQRRQIEFEKHSSRAYQCLEVQPGNPEYSGSARDKIEFTNQPKQTIIRDVWFKNQNPLIQPFERYVMNKEIILSRIKKLKDLPPREDNLLPTRSYQLYVGCISIVSQVYGTTSVQLEALKEERTRLMSLKSSEMAKYIYLIRQLHGLLNTVEADINDGLLESIQTATRGEVYADFLFLAKDSLENDSKDVAAVLASAALEDALKKYADSNGIDVSDKDMSGVISTLKAAHLVKGAEVKVVQSFVTLRNKAFHAQWDKISTPEINSMIGYVEQFLLTRFTVN